MSEHVTAHRQRPAPPLNIIMFKTLKTYVAYPNWSRCNPVAMARASAVADGGVWWRRGAPAPLATNKVRHTTHNPLESRHRAPITVDHVRILISVYQINCEIIKCYNSVFIFKSRVSELIKLRLRHKVNNICIEFSFNIGSLVVSGVICLSCRKNKFI